MHKKIFYLHINYNFYFVEFWVFAIVVFFTMVFFFSFFRNGRSFLKLCRLTIFSSIEFMMFALMVRQFPSLSHICLDKDPWRVGRNTPMILLLWNILKGVWWYRVYTIQNFTGRTIFEFNKTWFSGYSKTNSLLINDRFWLHKLLQHSTEFTEF